MTVLLGASHLDKTYRRQALIRSHAPRQVLFDINLEVRAGESLAILGRSGSGKSTLMRQLLGIETPSAGQVLFEGRDLATLDRSGWQHFRRSVQMVFQDSIGAVSPRQRIGRIIAEPLRHLSVLTAAEREHRVEQLLTAVGLKPSDALKRPGQMSGGQLQRVCIARALATQPRLLVLDEAVSNLDLTMQAQIIELIAHLRADSGMAVVFITHDLRLVRLLCERVIVLHHGRIVEEGPVDRQLRLSSAEGRLLQSAILPPRPKTIVQSQNMPNPAMR
ncbi:nickel import ATP-binding protein NikE [Devosia sp. 63-57]|uniref:nickel import ATP-binding protein NikE n=1 Tax=Devosia sp. 63-57 TaxID=1895751 RepID=UPI00086E5D25|nr:nickel import ATP-binding protein NikE [Devosia sp. 63-57]ODT47734.1 MAG: nickel import ATP-binding protein NikE [Pelagibacterium sp. SCN 63-126]ODU88210.1 MAG: nickel import ATP-binding protein NikE [Pelagibacterium sp. SCN 63-17]OJX42558.1 MAG: nickel import ATP-binding protein NikE [Devosia sp. 63-57]